MSLFGGKQRVELSGNITVRHERPPATYREMLDEEKAQEEWMESHEQVPFLNGERLDRNPTNDDLENVSFYWKWVKKST